jgi:hypothetical protein
MDKDEYIIISKTDIETRISEIDSLKKNVIKNMKELYQALNQNAIEYYKYKQSLSHTLSMLTTEGRTLKQILSQSTPLVPELQKGIQFGCLMDKRMSEINKQVKDYISNLKLDI